MIFGTGMTMAELDQNNLAPRVNALIDNTSLPAQAEKNSLRSAPLGRKDNSQGADYSELLKILAPGDNTSSPRKLRPLPAGIPTGRQWLLKLHRHWGAHRYKSDR
jgi:hypothetical protein